MQPDRHRLIALALLIAAAVLPGLRAHEGRQGSAGLEQPAVSPVAGPSWLNRLHVPAGESGLGRSGATYGPRPDQSPAPPPSIPLQIGRPVVLTGADLYRLNCQSCHRAAGTGSLPEIKSVFAAVQGSSLYLVRQHLKEQGKAATVADARTQASLAKAALFDRIKKGGQRMPPFPHLQDADVVALYAYLTELVGAPDAAAEARRTVTWARLGEHVVKGTCHICHDAVGPRPSGDTRSTVAIPAFNVLLQDKPVMDFLIKVRQGAAVTSADPAFHYRGRMPVFPFLRDLEVAAAYMFLVDYPPQAEAAPGRLRPYDVSRH
jgi:mono/diheme cytochrome c family protein